MLRSHPIKLHPKVEPRLVAGAFIVLASRLLTFPRTPWELDEFHFLELPVLVDFTLNKNKKTPLIWEAGFSFAYLLSSDYLYFDPYAKVYYKNDGVLNKDQWNLSTALMIGWNINQGRFLLGPQVQYGISGLLNSSQAYSQYLYSFGLKFSFIPGGK